MSNLRETCARIGETDVRIARETQVLLDAKTKPRKSLGRLERLACQIAAARGVLPVDPSRKAIVVMAADHGVAEEGVSAYAQEVTAQMLLNFAQGGAAINVLARHARAELVVVDMGVKTPPSHQPAIRDHRIGPGTRNFSEGPAMTRDDAIRAVEVGIGIAAGLARDGVNLLGMGDMGIGNTTSASALTSVLTGASPEEVTGRGTGIDDKALARKVEIIGRGLSVNRPDSSDAVDVLAKVGGFEIAGLAGVALGAAASKVPVVIDGFICSAAALAAARLAPLVTGYMVFSHRSVEVGHRVILNALDASPLFDLDLRLGEGTGAALAMTIVDASLAILRDMASFAATGMSDSGA